MSFFTKPLKEIKSIYLKEISLPKKTLRIGFSEIKELTDSISRFRLLYPIVLRSVKERFEFVAGNRRLSWHHIPYLIVKLNDDITEEYNNRLQSQRHLEIFKYQTITKIMCKYKKFDKVIIN